MIGQSGRWPDARNRTAICCLTAVRPWAQNDLLELIDSRFGFRSFLITSQLPMNVWHDAFDNKTVADALMDRVIHGSYHIQLSGESLRKAKRPTIRSSQKSDV